MCAHVLFFAGNPTFLRRNGFLSHGLIFFIALYYCKEFFTLEFIPRLCRDSAHFFSSSPSGMLRLLFLSHRGAAMSFPRHMRPPGCYSVCPRLSRFPAHSSFSLICVLGFRSHVLTYSSISTPRFSGPRPSARCDIQSVD